MSRPLLLLSLVLAMSCTARPEPLDDPPRAVVVTTEPSGSMIYLARVEGGVIAVDLGWVRASDGLRRGLARLDAAPEDVVAVFLTHTHRDHIGAWPLVRDAAFHLAADEVPRLLGTEPHRGWVPRLAALLPERLPAEGELAIEPFASDTTFVLGADTVRAFVVPGHTAGSAAYLFRGVLFVGDAMSRRPFGDLAPARPLVSDDTAEARRTLDSLFIRVAPHGVRWVCTAHARCSEFTPELVARVRRAGEVGAWP